MFLQRKEPQSSILLNSMHSDQDIMNQNSEQWEDHIKSAQILVDGQIF